jgi:hypothetical protein
LRTWPTCWAAERRRSPVGAAPASPARGPVPHPGRPTARPRRYGSAPGPG